MPNGDPQNRDGAKDPFLSPMNDFERTQSVDQHTLDGLRELVIYQETRREEERIDLAREIHDQLGTLLTGIKACLTVMAAADAKTAGAPHPRQVEALGLTDTALAGVERMIGNLHPSVLDHLGLWSGLEWYVDQFGHQADLVYGLDFTAGARALHISTTYSTLLFRVVQDALSHVGQYAQASEVTIRAYLHEHQLVIEVEDNGRGVVPESGMRSRTLALAGPRERLNRVGGQINTMSLQGQGARLVVQCPLEPLNG